MKVNRLYTLLFAVAGLFSFMACGEDRTHEYLEKTEENQWTFSTMKDVYLWADGIKTPERKNFFSTTSKFFNSLLYKNDKASFFTDSVSDGSYGLAFSLMRDPLGEKMNRYYALVLYVEPGSPAAMAGIERGMWISAVDGKSLTASNSKVLVSGGDAKVATEWIDYNDDDERYFWVNGDTLSMHASHTFGSRAIYLDSVYNVREGKLGYMVCSNFNGDSFANEVQEILLEFAAAEVDDIVIDMRYCDGGTMENATALASALVSASFAGTPFAVLKGKDETADTIHCFTESPVNMSEKRLFFIIGEGTKGSAELLVESVNVSRDMYDVMVLGANSAGENVMTREFVSPYGFSINPAVAVICTPNGEKLPPNGIVPDYPLDELEEVKHIYPLGSEQEYMLRNIIYLIVNGSLPQ